MLLGIFKIFLLLPSGMEMISAIQGLKDQWLGWARGSGELRATASV
jgi:hypothetical protein